MEETTLPEAALPNSFTPPYVLHVLMDNINPFSFKIRGKACVSGTRLSFRIDYTMSNCCSHESLLHLGPQSSHLIICYYHQDLHQELFH